ncbi:hypothetical protein [Methylocapsa aurea]|uniref:hypothetical protein n=1 Tax=Methylocapsa aurea TaxID=663610 RepID=UPI0012EBA1A1|nr:hypothetical protein [Methylocapsa aurea]
MISRQILLSLPLLAAATFALSACDAGRGGTATISYRQVGACNGYDAAGGRVATRQNEAFIVFKIEAVDNSQAGIDFTFVPARLYVDQSTEQQKAEWIGNRIHRTLSNDPRFSQSLGVVSIAPVTVPQGQKIEPKGYAVVAVATAKPNGAEEASQTSYELLYDSQSVGAKDPAIVFNKTNASQTTWPQTDDCKAIKL